MSLVCESGSHVSMLEEMCHQCVSAVHLSQCWRKCVISV